MAENYYILLELDPSVKDEASINKAITAKQQQWSAERNHPTKGVLAQQYLGKLSDIKALFANPERRNKEAEEAKQKLHEQAQEKYKKLQTAAAILIVNGEIAEKDLAALAKKFKLSEEETLKIIKAKIKKGEVIDLKDDGIQLLDDSVVKKIRSDLNIVGKKDLFDFLALAPTSSCTLILQKAQELYTQASRNANKTADVTATVSLATTCQTYLKDDATKKRYQKSLQFESFDEIKDLIDLAANDKFIDSNEYQKLIQECSKQGIPLDRAEFYIHDYCKKKGFPAPQTMGTANYKKQIQCGICNYLNDASANNCNNCGTPLKLICPKCGKEATRGQQACSQCGFSIGDMPNVIPLIRDADIELSKGNFEDAKKYLKQAKLFWETHPDIKKIEMAMAEAYCRQAKSETNHEKKLALFFAALEVCADYNDAILGVSSVPIEPPGNLTVTTDKKTVFLKWSAPTNSKALKYVILRKINSIPANDSDGEQIAEVEYTNYQDSLTEFGINYYYAVFSKRGRNCSSLIFTTNPIVFDIDSEDVKNLNGRVLSGKLYLEWDWAPGCQSVKIEYSHKGFPNSSHGAMPTAISFTKEQYDREKAFVILQPVNQDYYFRVYNHYKISGNDFYSKGINFLVVNSEKINIKYKVVVRDILFIKSAFIQLECKHNISLPEMLVVAKREGLPINRTDGKQIMKISNKSMSSRLQINLPFEEVKTQHIRLFFTDDHANKKYNLVITK